LQALTLAQLGSAYLGLAWLGSRPEARPSTALVMDQLCENKLYLCDEKCEFEKEHIEYLGVIILHNKVEMDPVKVAGVTKWPMPTCKKEVQLFIGFINFYHHFILNFSHHTHALFDLTLKDVKFIWSSAQEDTFTQLKDLVTSSPILIPPNANRPYQLEADGSEVTTGAVLLQQDDNGKWQPVAFLSKALSLVKRNYEIHDTEMLAIIRALEEW